MPLKNPDDTLKEVTSLQECDAYHQDGIYDGDDAYIIVAMRLHLERFTIELDKRLREGMNNPKLPEYQQRGINTGLVIAIDILNKLKQEQNEVRTKPIQEAGEETETGSGGPG